MALTQGPRDKDHQVTIVLLGVTGAGKSTFASIASRSPVTIGHGIEPCTQDPLAVRFKLPDSGQSIVLIDTPGFDDSVRTDLEILADIAKWLASQGFVRKHPLDGLILLHPATHAVVRRNETQRTRLLEKLLGDDAYSRVIIATTMWENLSAEEFMASVGGHMGRFGEQGVWANFRKKGATFMRHDNTEESAHKIIQHIVSKSKDLKAKTLLHGGLADNARVGDEVRQQLEEAFDFTHEQLKLHKKERPPKEDRKSKDSEKQRRYMEWEAEKRELEEMLKAQERRLKKLDSMILRMINVFARLFW
ncbi:P-loop containing nucleoside triphosphate hydrolase protein [Cercophora newfieldiana]|uniref:P-loop containing nucleoside triphosphate hydrolase protein n=1 Tax=Cercophora newfieldiana TaxID=92897 RepID=A0AA40CRX2_9PEZI|nr:P-loop containing nucleoside triphosphate hydrolase protein [Cercophora newfieldiana]